MLRSFLLLSVRNLFRKNKLYTAVNVAGLAVGLASVWLVAMFVYDEYTFDKHYLATDRICRVVVDFTSEGNVTSWAKTSAPIGKYLQGAFPEIEHVTRIRKNPGTDLISIGTEQFYENKLFFADSTFFQIFDIPFIKGKPNQALNERDKIVLTKALAQKYFGTTDVLGKVIRFDNRIDLEVTGVIEPMEHNSHFVGEGFITFSTLTDLLGEQRLNHWGQFDHYTYLLLSPGSSMDALEVKLPGLLKRHAPEWVQEKESLKLQALADIHLQSDRKDEITPNGSKMDSYTLSSIALLILLMTCANFINLHTATQLGRVKVTAVQKILGADQGRLLLYYISESSILSLTALACSVILTYIVLPEFNSITDKNVTLIQSQWLIMPAIATCVFITLFTGIFSALQTRLPIVTQLSRATHLTSSKSVLRKSLIVFQFSISIFLVMATGIVSSQLDMLHNSRVGFDSENAAVVPIKDRSKNDRYAALRNELEQLPGISKASFSSSTPGTNTSLTYTYSVQGSEMGEQPLATFIVDDHFLDLYEIKLLSGRMINPVSTDTLSEVLLNEAAVRMLQLEDPVGHLVTGKVKGKVVGVVENFNFSSLRDPVQPMIMYAFTPTFRFVSVKFDDRVTGLESLARKWPQLYNGYPLEYGFLDDQIHLLYGPETRLGDAYHVFSIIAIIIAGIGLIGLTTFFLNQRMKEISVRKVFGGSVWQILIWLYTGYVSIIFLSSAVATVAGYFVMRSWLNNFNYRVSFDLSFFIIPSLILTIVLLITTGFQSVRATLSNPIEYLRQE